jgi:hypothetical protein
MGRTCDDERDKECIQNFGGKIRNCSHIRPRIKFADNIQMDYYFLNFGLSPSPSYF